LVRFEVPAMESPVEVDGILASDDLVLPGFRLFHHLGLLAASGTQVAMGDGGRERVSDDPSLA